jgi:hypothetical protein
MVAGAIALFRLRRHVRRWKQAFYDQDWPGRDWHQHWRQAGWPAAGQSRRGG